MIIGNGVDTIEIGRVKSLIEKNERFILRNFTDKERVLFESKHNKAESIAGNFAAKEAISKSFGTGIRGFNLSDLEILRDELGKPYVVLYNEAKSIAEKLGIKNIHVSISHDKTKAIAFAIAESL